MLRADGVIRRAWVAAWLASCVAAVSALPGCVVWDIQEGIAASNAHLGRIEGELGAIDEGLEHTNARLETVEGRLASMDEQLARLQTQLDATNAHLQSLRKTINNIDSTIPFLKLSGDDDAERALLEDGGEGVEEKGPSASPESGSDGGER